MKKWNCGTRYMFNQPKALKQHSEPIKSFISCCVSKVGNAVITFAFSSSLFAMQSAYNILVP